MDSFELPTSDAERWEAGSVQDPMRNSFLIPALVNLFEESRPTTILDIGSATGYLPRTIDAQLSYRPTWTLIERDAARLTLFDRLAPPTMIREVIQDEFQHANLAEASFGAVIATFTLLEMEDWAKAIRKVIGLVGLGGFAILALPDVWRDALENPGADREVHRKLWHGLEIAKVDKFTGNPYPFNAVRMEAIIEMFLTDGFVLTDLMINRPALDAFLLVFCKAPSALDQTRSR